MLGRCNNGYGVRSFMCTPSKQPVFAMALSRHVAAGKWIANSDSKEKQYRRNIFYSVLSLD